MKKILIISYYGYTHSRIFGLAKYLPEFGWQPVILTMPVEEMPPLLIKVVETPCATQTLRERLIGAGPRKEGVIDNALQGIRGQAKKRLSPAFRRDWVLPILSFCGAILNYPDNVKGWKPLEAGIDLLQQENIQAIISSNPVTSHLIASKLKDRYNIPWLADFRDLWSQNHNYSYGPIRRWMDRRLELKTLAQVDALITVSQPASEKLSQLHKGKPAFTITNGFDPAEVNTPPAKLADKFTITYTGSIYTGKQDPTKLLIALRDLIADGIINPNEIELRFYGSGHNRLDWEIKQYGLANLAKQYGPVPRDIAVEKQRESQLLLLLDWEDPKEYGVYTGKVFDYLAARRPILATGGSRDDVVGRLLGQTRAGMLAPAVEDVKHTLKQFYQEFKQQGEVIYYGDESEINKYNHREMARQFAEVLEKQVVKEE